jgi:hypothetical protein
VPVGDAAELTLNARRPVAFIHVGTGGPFLADDRAAFNGDQLKKPFARQRQAAGLIEGSQRLHEMQMGVHQFPAGLTFQQKSCVSGRSRPIRVEKLNVAAISLIMRLGFEQLEKIRGEIEHFRLFTGQVVFGQRIQGERLTVDVLACLGLMISGAIDFPVESAVFGIPHFLAQKTVTEIGGLKQLFSAVRRHFYTRAGQA